MQSSYSVTNNTALLEAVPSLPRQDNNQHPAVLREPSNKQRIQIHSAEDAIGYGHDFQAECRSISSFNLLTSRQDLHNHVQLRYLSHFDLYLT